MTSKNVRTFELKWGKRALILFIIGMSCILFITFLFGVTVGKNVDTYPEKFSRGLPGLLMEKFGWSSRKAETAVAGVAEEPKEPVNVEGEEKGVEEKKIPLTTPGVTEEKQPVVTATQEQKPPPPPVADRALSKSAPGKEKYHIQVISLKDRGKADQLSKKLTPLGFKPKVVVIELPGKGKWYRIIIEGFESREQAQKAIDSMEKKVKGLNCVISKTGEKNN
jgi:cell division septation protein DedD